MYNKYIVKVFTTLRADRRAARECRPERALPAQGSARKPAGKSIGKSSENRAKVVNKKRSKSSHAKKIRAEVFLFFTVFCDFVPFWGAIWGSKMIKKSTKK